MNKCADGSITIISSSKSQNYLADEQSRGTHSSCWSNELQLREDVAVRKVQPSSTSRQPGCKSACLHETHCVLAKSVLANTVVISATAVSVCLPPIHLSQVPRCPALPTDSLRLRQTAQLLASAPVVVAAAVAAVVAETPELGSIWKFGVLPRDHHQIFLYLVRTSRRDGSRRV